MGSRPDGRMTIYETLLNMLGVLIDSRIELFPRPKEDPEKAQRIEKERADEWARRCEEDPGLQLRVVQEMRASKRAYIAANLTVREGAYWFRTALFDTGPHCISCWDADGRLVTMYRKISGTFSCGFCASKTVIQERNAYIDARVKMFMEFGTRYAAAWSSQDPARLAAFYTENGSLTVNDGAPSVGRAAITETARRFMTAFPDMVVKMTVTRGGAAGPAADFAIFYCTWTGTNIGPAGTGQSVGIYGYEDLRLDADGLIAASRSVGYPTCRE
jgi:hypothetical protein